MKTMRNISQVAFFNPLNPNISPCNPFSWPTFSVYVGGLWVGLFIINPKTAGGISQRLCHPACGVRPTGGKAFSPFSKTICEIAALPCFLLLFSAFPRFQFAAFVFPSCHFHPRSPWKKCKKWKSGRCSNCFKISSALPKGKCSLDAPMKKQSPDRFPVFNFT